MKARRTRGTARKQDVANRRVKRSQATKTSKNARKTKTIGDPVDLEKVLNELIALRCSAVREVPFTEMQQHVDRLRALLPADPDLADSDNPQAIKRLYQLLDDIKELQTMGAFPPCGCDSNSVLTAGPQWVLNLQDLIRDLKDFDQAEKLGYQVT